MSSQQMNENSDHWKVWAISLFLILLLGAGLRFLGIHFGYPLQLHSDEPPIVNAAIKMAESNTLIAPGYERPDNVVKKASAVLYKFFSKLIYATSLWGRRIDHSNDMAYYLVSRYYVAALGILTIFIAYLIGRRFSLETGILGALFVALEPFHVLNSHYVTSDVSVTLNMCLCMLFALRYEEKPNYWRLIPMAFFAALGTLDKYPGILTCGMLGLTVILCQRKDIRQMIRHAAVLLVLVIAFLFIISPNLFWDFPAVWTRIQVENRNEHLGQDGLGFGGNLMSYVRLFFQGWKNGEIFLALFFAAGCARLLLVRQRRNIVFSVLPIWWVLLSTRGLHWARWGVPMYIGALLICAFGVGGFIHVVKPRMLRYGALAVVTGLCLYFPLAEAISMDAQLCAVDTRQIAYERVRSLGIQESNTIYDELTAFFLHGANRVSWTESTTLEDGQLVVNALGKKYAFDSSRQRTLLKAAPEREPEKLAEYLWLEENRKPFETIKPVLNIKSTTKIPLVLSMRKLMAALLDGQDGYVTGFMQRFYDISDLPIRLQIKPDGLKAQEDGALILMRTAICARQYTIRVQKTDGIPVLFEMVDQETGDVIASWEFAGQEAYTVTIKRDYPNVSLTLKAREGAVNFEAVTITSG